MRLPRIHPLIAFMTGCLAALAGLLLWVRSGRELQLSFTRAQQHNRFAAQQALEQRALDKIIRDKQEREEKEAQEALTYLPARANLTGDFYQDIADKNALRAGESLGQTFAQCSDSIRWAILDRENEHVCLRCGEINPATLKKGYPVESCHVCPKYPFVRQNRLDSGRRDGD